MKTSDFYYDLPKELIAQDPLEDRSSSRLLVLHRKSGRVEHRVFTDIVEYLKPGDCLVRNNTKVIPARLYGTSVDTGATIELLLLKRMENDVWETLVKPGKKARKGAVISFGDGMIKSLNTLTFMLSSLMMSAQILTQSSKIKLSPFGLAISFFAAFCGLPQKLQAHISISFI